MTNNEALKANFLKHYDVEAREIIVDEGLIAKLIKENAGQYFHLKSYITKTFFSGRLIEAIVDLSNQYFFDQNFTNIDFTGCIFTGAQFSNCNFHKTILRNLDLTNVQFIDCNFTEADLRGAYFANCIFQSAAPLAHYQNLKLSGTKDQLKQLIENDQQVLEKLKADNKQILDDKILALNSQIQELTKELSYSQNILNKFRFKTGHAEYDEAIENLQTLLKKENKANLPEYFLSATLNDLLSAEVIWDKYYSLQQLDKKVIKIDREEVINYLYFIRSNEPISLYEYLEKDNDEVIISLSDDYSEMNFSNVNFSNVFFIGSTLRNCMFVKANITGANFAGVDLEEAIFDEVNAKNCDFTHANMENLFINNSNFNNSIFDYANLSKSSLLNSNANFVLARKSLFVHTKIGKCHFNYAGLDSSSFAEAEIMDCVFFRSNFKNTTFHHSRIIDTSYNCSTLANTDFSKSQISDCSFNFVFAPNVNLSDSYCSSKISLNNAFLVNAKFIRLYSNNFTCINSLLNNADLTNAKISTLVLNDSLAINIKCFNSVFNTIKANFTNLAKANFEGLSSQKSAWESSILVGSNITNAKIVNGNFIHADLRNSNCSKSNFKRSNFSYAKLNNTQLTETNLSVANLTNTEIDYTTDLNSADITEVQGYLKITTQNNRTVYPIQFKENCDKLYEEKNKSVLAKIDSIFFKQMHNLLNILALLFRESHRTIFNRIFFGLIIAYVYLQAAMVYIDDKTSINSLIILMGGAIVSYLIGFITSNYIYQHIIGINIIALLFGWHFGSYPGILYGLLLGISFNNLIKLKSSISLNEHLDLFIMKAANFAIEISDGVRSSKEAKEFYALRKADQKNIYQLGSLDLNGASTTLYAINIAEINYARYLSFTEQDSIIFIDNGKINIDLKSQKSFDNTQVIDEKNNSDDVADEL